MTLYGIKTYDRNESYNEVNSVDNRMAKIKFYSCKIWDDDELIRDFIPVISNEEGHVGEAALFDKVRKEFYYNHGSGNFSVPEN